MNYIKYLFSFCLLLVCLENNAQLGAIGKATAKAGIKTIVKNSIKEGGQRIFLKEIKENAIKKGVKMAIAERIEHSVTSTVAKELSQKAFRESAENMAKKSTKLGGKKIIKQQTKRIAQGKVENSCKHFLRAKASDYVLGATKHTLNVTEHIASKKIAKEGVDEAIKIEAKHIQKAIGKSGYTQVERILPNTNDQKRLLEDIINTPQLAKAFQKDNGLIQNYAQCINSKCRTDIRTLRYLNNGADSYADACMFSNSKYTRAKFLEFTDEKSKTIIKNAKTGEILGSIEDNNITIPSNNHALLNMKLMSNMKYKVDNTIFETDKIGRPIKVSAHINPKFKDCKIYERDKIIQRDFKKARINASKLDASKLDDDAGHIIAHDLGGVSDGINILPQNASLNRGAYKKMENKIKKDVKKGNKAYIEVEMVYSRASERPSEYIYSYYKNGALDSQVRFYNK